MPEVADGLDIGEFGEAHKNVLVDVAKLGEVLQDDLLGGLVQDVQHDFGGINCRHGQLHAPSHQVRPVHLQALLVACTERQVLSVIP